MQLIIPIRYNSYPQSAHIPRILSIPAFFGITVLAASVALFKYAKGDRVVVWQPTKRSY